MPTLKKTNVPPHLIFIGAMIVIGLGGFLYAYVVSHRQASVNTDNGPQLQVIDGTGNQPQDQIQPGAGTALQGAVKTQDLIQGKNGDSVQSGGSIDTLLKDKTIQ